MGSGQCQEAGCGRSTVGQGWCEMHYSRFVRSPKKKAAVLAAKVGRLCVHCGAVLAVEKNSRAAFCDRTCKTAARNGSGEGRVASLRSYYKRKYGLTLAEVEEMRGGGCEICGAPNGGGRHGQLHIDHCHSTGRVRGVLCDSCNTGLGKFRDRPDFLRSAAAYLERPSR